MNFKKIIQIFNKDKNRIEQLTEQDKNYCEALHRFYGGRIRKKRVYSKFC